jgi:hypothetical protein
MLPLALNHGRGTCQGGQGGEQNQANDAPEGWAVAFLRLISQDSTKSSEAGSGPSVAPACLACDAVKTRPLRTNCSMYTASPSAFRLVYTTLCLLTSKQPYSYLVMKDLWLLTISDTGIWYSYMAF